MPSSFNWVDFAEDDRRKMMEILHIFKEQDIREELGLGSIRDAYSDILFPGTGTLQTRAKYMLLVPWIFLEHERRATQSDKIASLSRRAEINLIFSLLKSGETDGVIGKNSKQYLKTMPSGIYWTGLGRWGIRRFNGSLGQYFRYLTRFYLLRKNKVLSDDKEPVEGIPTNWDTNIVSRPKDFPESVKMALTREEATYLHDRILASCSESLLAFLVDKTRPTNPKGVPYIWQHPEFEKFPDRLRKIVTHAHNFSQVMHSAALLYNLMLSEKINKQEWKEEYREKIKTWADDIEKRSHVIEKWKLEEFWEIASEENNRIPRPTVNFVKRWIQLIREKKKIKDVSDDREARRLVYEREVRIKRNRSRLKNPQMLQQWEGASGAGALDFRWPFARRVVNDILRGLKGR